MSQFDIKSRQPVVAGKKSIAIDVEKGKDYYWCTCGLSKNQPFCDGSHKQLGEGAGPMKYTAEETKKVWFCACKQTGTAPFCDGSHKRIPERVAVGQHWDTKKGDYKLMYFDLHGAGELARVIFALAGVPFEDVRYPISNFLGEEAAKKFTGNVGHGWSDDKASMPYGHLPVLEFKGVKIAESNAIARFLATRFRLAGDNDIEAALVDATCEHLRDIATEARKWYQLPQDQQQAYKDKFLAELKEKLSLLEKQIQNNGGKFLVGKRLSLADLTLWRTVRVIGAPDDKVSAGVLAVLKGVESDANIAKYLAERQPRPL